MRICRTLIFSNPRVILTPCLFVNILAETYDENDSKSNTTLPSAESSKMLAEETRDWKTEPEKSLPAKSAENPPKKPDSSAMPTHDEATPKSDHAAEDSPEASQQQPTPKSDRAALESSEDAPPQQLEEEESNSTGGPPAKRRKTRENGDVSTSTATAASASSAPQNSELIHKSEKASNNCDSAAMEDDVSTPKPSAAERAPTSSSSSSSSSSSHKLAADMNGTANQKPRGDAGQREKASDKMAGFPDDKPNNSESKCSLVKLDKPAPPELLKRELYFEMGWRDKLCRCDECVGMFAEYRLSFMLEDEDGDEEGM